jgi:hypothetical protein
MVMARGRTSARAQLWIDARKRHRLSQTQVQMARALGMNPKKLGKIDNHKQEPWKLPLPQFIEKLYYKRFGKKRPHLALPIEQPAIPPHQKNRQKNQAGRLGSRGNRDDFPEISDAEDFAPIFDDDVPWRGDGHGALVTEFVPSDDDDIPFIIPFDVLPNRKFRA